MSQCWKTQYKRYVVMVVGLLGLHGRRWKNGLYK